MAVIFYSGNLHFANAILDSVGISLNNFRLKFPYAPMHRIAFHCSCKPCFPFEKLRSKYIEFGKEKRHIWIENQEANANGKTNNKGKYVHVLNDITNNGLCVQLLTWVSENVCVCFDILRCQHFSSACKSSDKTGIPNVHDTHTGTLAHSIQYWNNCYSTLLSISFQF